VASKQIGSKGYQVRRSHSGVEILMFESSIQAEECSAILIVSLTAFVVGPACSDLSVFVDDGESVVFEASAGGCGAGVPSRSLLVESLSDITGVPFCIWFSVSLSSSL
jgi:hypothetical protein